MSYNTRRTGGGAGRPAPTTQVNYHQQPNRPVSGNTAPQSRNPGYSTTQAAYNNTPAFTTTPPLPPSQPKPAQPAQQQPQQQLQQPPLPPMTPAVKPPVTPVATPTFKQEPVTPVDSTKMETTENGESTTVKPPFWKKRPFLKVSNKVRKARQNAKLRRILNPKNALTFLNELRPGAGKFVVREEAGWGYVATMEIDGKTFTGHGLNTSKAKMLASEKALRHLLLEQLAKSQQAAAAEARAQEDKSAEGEDQVMESVEQEGEEVKSKKAKTQAEDEVPWGSLAAFALHKLFTEWQKEGPESITEPYPDKYEDEMAAEEPYFTRRPPGPPEFGPPRRGGYAPYPVRGRGFGPFPGPRGPHPLGYGMPPPARRALPPAASFINPASKPHVAGPAAPMRKIPEDANQRHPVMLLNQLKPNVIYNETREGDPPKVVFVITVEIDGKQYIGRGKNKKEAKKEAAKEALAPLGIIYRDED